MRAALMLTTLLAIALAAPVTAAQGARRGAPHDIAATLKLPHTRQRLANGLDVILHEDHSQPLVVVNLNYQVGSRDERPGRTGFAHLFEHLMFMGTKRVPTKKFDAWMEAEGGWNNAWTSQDRTNYFDVGPSHMLPLLLWLEADRLQALGSQIDQSKLDTQRDVVRNERRQQVENQPYGVAELELPALLFPEGHPYHHPVIGSYQDLEAATVGDVRAFFDSWYVPRNASLVIAGDFDPAEAKTLVQRYFGSVAAGKPPPPRGKPAKPARIDGVVRKRLEDKVSFPKVIMSWLSPPLYAKGDAELDLLGSVLSDGKVSRLYKALVYDAKLAQSVTAYQASGQLRSHFNVEAVARPGVKLEQLEQAIDEQLAKVRAQPVSQAELDRARNGYATGFVRGMQSLARRASLLNGYAANGLDPDWAGNDLRRYLRASRSDVHRLARQVLDPKQRVILHVVPKPERPPEEGPAEKPATGREAPKNDPPKNDPPKNDPPKGTSKEKPQ
jgi:predicted Zn-dependent peptidase